MDFVMFNSETDELQGTVARVLNGSRSAAFKAAPVPGQACQAAAEEEEEKAWTMSACVGLGCLRTARASSGTVGGPTTAAAFVLGPCITYINYK